MYFPKYLDKPAGVSSADPDQNVTLIKLFLKEQFDQGLQGLSGISPALLK